MKSLLDLISNKDLINQDLEIKLANRILVSNDFSLKENFRKIIENFYNSDVKEVNFNSNAKNITKELNDWVSEKTNGKIERIFKESLDSHSSVVLANSVFFHSKWKFPFNPNNTQKGEFKNSGDISSKIDLMTTQNKFRVNSVPKLESRLIELPFSGSENHNISMIVVSFWGYNSYF